MNAHQVIKQWEDCLNSGELENIVNLYADDAVLWGTFSKIIRDKSDLIQEYFKGLFQKQELQVNFGTIHSRVYEDTHIFSGMYEFSYMDEKLISHPARFTFVICKNESGNFEIVEHHSSLIPS